MASVSTDYTKIITRLGMSYADIDIWRQGEGDELKKWIGFGFYNTQFIKHKDRVDIYYDNSELMGYDKVLEDNFDEELFDKMCDEYFRIIESSMDPYQQRVKMMPILTIFDELSKYPEWGNERMMRRLIRIRDCTHEYSYGLPVKYGKY